jgi:hypothetical protein
MVQRVTADVVAGAPGASPDEVKAGALTAVTQVLAKTQPYQAAGQGILGVVAVGGGVLALLSKVFGKAKEGVGKLRQYATKKPAEEPAPAKRARRPRRR